MFDSRNVPQTCCLGGLLASALGPSSHFAPWRVYGLRAVVGRRSQRRAFSLLPNVSPALAVTPAPTAVPQREAHANFLTKSTISAHCSRRDLPESGLGYETPLPRLGRGFAPLCQLQIS